jgi:hypothetical protein
MLRRIELAVFRAGASTPNEEGDVAIVFNAWKYHATLITADGGSRRQPRGILGAAEELAALGVRVVSDQEACAIVETAIHRRDSLAREYARETGSDLPSWVGADS